MHLDTSCEYYTQSGVQSNCTPNQMLIANAVITNARVELLTP
jgi:hypothetical protein